MLKKRVVLSLLAVLFGQGVSAQTEILCSAREQWTFAEEIARPASWAFNVIFDFQNQLLTNFQIGGLNCGSITEVYVTDESIGFKCRLDQVGGVQSADFTTNISRLSGEFFIHRQYSDSNDWNGLTIGDCQNGSRRF
jgi:hypothetical protein